MFDFEWTGRSHGNDADRERGIEAAKNHCAEMGYDPAQIWSDATEREDQDAWSRWHLIENRAIAHLAQGWQQTPENVSLIWR